MPYCGQFTIFIFPRCLPSGGIFQPGSELRRGIYALMRANWWGAGCSGCRRWGCGEISFVAPGQGQETDVSIRSKQAGKVDF